MNTFGNSFVHQNAETFIVQNSFSKVFGCVSLIFFNDSIMENFMELHSAPDLPWTIFECWFALAQQSEPSNPEAMTLATVDADGVPQVRIVLMKDIGQDGVVFFTNSQSTKGQNIAHNPNVALLF